MIESSLVLVCAFSFTNNKPYKGRATWRKETFTVACYCVGEAALLVSCCQRASRPSYFL